MPGFGTRVATDYTTYRHYLREAFDRTRIPKKIAAEAIHRIAEHERQHIEVWRKYGIDAIYALSCSLDDGLPIPFTTPYVATPNLAIPKILFAAVYARPYDSGLGLRDDKDAVCFMGYDGIVDVGKRIVTHKHTFDDALPVPLTYVDGSEELHYAPHLEMERLLY